MKVKVLKFDVSKNLATVVVDVLSDDGKTTLSPAQTFQGKSRGELRGKMQAFARELEETSTTVSVEFAVDEIIDLVDAPPAIVDPTDEELFVEKVEDLKKLDAYKALLARNGGTPNGTFTAELQTAVTAATAYQAGYGKKL